MLIAYIDEVGEAGAFISKDHKRLNTSPVFGYAGFVVPEQHVCRESLSPPARARSRKCTDPEQTVVFNVLTPRHTGSWRSPARQSPSPDPFFRPRPGFPHGSPASGVS